jgi:hypothetical protein
MSESQRLDASLQAYRVDWRAVARYTVRFKGLHFSGQSHIQRVIATNVAWDEAGKIRHEETTRMAAEGVRGHILFDLDRPGAARAQYTRERAASELRGRQG